MSELPQEQKATPPVDWQNNHTRYLILNPAGDTVVYDTAHLPRPIAGIILNPGEPESAIMAWADGEPSSPIGGAAWWQLVPQMRAPSDLPPNAFGFWVCQVEVGRMSETPPPVVANTPLPQIHPAFRFEGQPRYVAVLFEKDLPPELRESVN